MNQSKPKHTPGKWTVEETNDSSFILGTESQIAVLELSDAFSVDEHRANARLIACAPEMIQALRIVLIGLNHKGYINLTIHETAVHDHVSKLIARAEGAD